jgi:hypothetical protein
VTELRDVVVDRWHALDAAARSSGAGIVTSPAPVDTPHGPVLLGLDAAGNNHLLVPLGARQTVVPDLTGRAVHLLLRPLEDAVQYRNFADLKLLDPSLLDVFTSLCEDVLVAVAATPEKAVRALRRVLDEWRQLLSGEQGPLGAPALAGLFGELNVLRTLLRADSGLAESWHGPTGAAKDFHLAGNAIEVKTTTAPEGRTIRVHGTDQLEAPTGGSLCLVWFRLARTPTGISVPDLVEEVLELADDTSTIRKGLAELGYRERDSDRYSSIRYEVVERRCHLVEEGFPRIVMASLTGDALENGIDDIEYSVDLDSPDALEHEIPDFTPFIPGAS